MDKTCNIFNEFPFDYDSPYNASRDDDDDDDEPKTYLETTENRVCYSLGCIIRYIGTPNFREKVLWVYSHLKSDFFSKSY